jgi:hypothetical protein
MSNFTRASGGLVFPFTAAPSASAETVVRIDDLQLRVDALTCLWNSSIAALTRDASAGATTLSSQAAQ